MNGKNFRFAPDATYEIMNNITLVGEWDPIGLDVLGEVMVEGILNETADIEEIINLNKDKIFHGSIYR